MVLGAGGQHHRLGERVGGLRRDRHPLGGDADLVDPAGRGVVVLDRAAGRAGVGEKADRLRDTARFIRVQPLAVHVERQCSRGSEPTDVLDELVARHRLVALANREREAGARRRERLEAERLQEHR